MLSQEIDTMIDDFSIKFNPNDIENYKSLIVLLYELTRTDEHQTDVYFLLKSAVSKIKQPVCKPILYQDQDYKKFVKDFVCSKLLK